MLELSSFLNRLLENRYTIVYEIVEYISGKKLLITIDNEIQLFINQNLTCNVIYGTGHQQNNIELNQALHNIRLELEL